MSSVVGIPLVSQARSRGCGGRWLRRAKTHARVAGARWSITVRRAALFAGENPRHARCGSIRRRRTRPTEAARQLRRAKQPDSLAASASTWSSTCHFADDVTHTHKHTHTHLLYTTVEQVCALMHSPEKEIIFLITNVKKKHNASDCGVCGIAHTVVSSPRWFVSVMISIACTHLPNQVANYLVKQGL